MYIFVFSHFLIHSGVLICFLYHIYSCCKFNKVTGLRILFDFFRAGVKLSAIEVRYTNLSIEAECEVVYGKPLPTLWNSLKSMLLVCNCIFFKVALVNQPFFLSLFCIRMLMIFWAEQLEY